MNPAKRKQMWSTKRLFFLTPHVLQNDLVTGAFSAKDIVCLVFDEAHKAMGNYAYCQVCISTTVTLTLDVISDTVSDMINTIYCDKPLILISHHQAVSINC